MIHDCTLQDRSRINYSMLTCTWPTRRRRVKATISDIADIHIPKFGNKYRIQSMTKISMHKYAICVSDMNDINQNVIYDVDAKSWDARRIGIDTMPATCVARDGAFLIASSYHFIKVYFRDGKSGLIQIHAKSKLCKNGWLSSEGVCKQRGDYVYFIDRVRDLKSFKWSDIIGDIKGIDPKSCAIAKNVDDFVPADPMPAILTEQKLLTLPNKKIVDLKAISQHAAWAILHRIGKHWIVSGDLDGQAIIASVNDSAKIKSTISVRLTSNGWPGTPSMFSIKTAIDRKAASFMLALERDGWSHLLAIDGVGRLTAIESLAAIASDKVDYPDRYYRTVTAVAEGDEPGECYVCGYSWVKKIKVSIN